MQQGIWHTLEFSSYSGNIDLWVDAKPGASTRSLVLTVGNILSIGAAYLPPESIVLIDDITICELSAPFQSLYAAQ